MYHLSTENRILTNPSSLSDNIAHHIREYQIYGKVVIITDKPDKLLTEIKQAWNDLKREMRQQIDSLPSDSTRKSLLVNQLMYMQYCTFTTKPPIDNPREQVMIATPEQIAEWPPICQTIYVTIPMESHELHTATAWMPPYGLVVLYE